MVSTLNILPIFQSHISLKNQLTDGLGYYDDGEEHLGVGEEAHECESTITFNFHNVLTFYHFLDRVPFYVAFRINRTTYTLTEKCKSDDCNNRLLKRITSSLKRPEN